MALSGVILGVTSDGTALWQLLFKARKPHPSSNPFSCSSTWSHERLWFATLSSAEGLLTFRDLKRGPPHREVPLKKPNINPIKGLTWRGPISGNNKESFENLHRLLCFLKSVCRSFFLETGHSDVYQFL